MNKLSELDGDKKFDIGYRYTSLVIFTEIEFSFIFI